MLHPRTRWLMRVARLRAATLDPSGADHFTMALASYGLPYGASRLSRWEYGRSGGSARLLRGYEDGTDLPAFLLFALNDRQKRVADTAYAGGPSVEVLSAVQDQEVHEILDRALTGGAVSGSDWYAMASFSAARDYFYLSRDNTARLVARLLAEVAQSLGPAYILRFEALQLLAAEPRVRVALENELTRVFEADVPGDVGDSVSFILRTAKPVRRMLVSRLRDSTSPANRHARNWITEIIGDRHRRKTHALDRGQLGKATGALFEALPEWATAHIELDIARPLLHEALGHRSRLVRHEASLVLMLAGAHEPLTDRLLQLLEGSGDVLLRQRLANLLEYQVPAGQGDRLRALLGVETDELTKSSFERTYLQIGRSLEPESVPVALRRDGDSHHSVDYSRA